MELTIEFKVKVFLEAPDAGDEFSYREIIKASNELGKDIKQQIDVALAEVITGLIDIGDFEIEVSPAKVV